MDESMPPEFIIRYLKLCQQLTDLQNSTKQVKQAMKQDQEIVTKWLLQQVECSLPLNFNSDEEKNIFGKPGKLKLTRRKKLETLSDKKIYTYLLSFFGNMYPDNGPESIKNLSLAATKHIKNSRQVVNSTRVCRTYTTKKPSIVDL